MTENMQADCVPSRQARFNQCFLKDSCKGCAATCGKPFGGSCIEAEYIKTGGREAYAEFKRRLLREVNELLSANDMPPADKLCELPGSFVDLAYAYPLPELAAYKRR